MCPAKVLVCIGFVGVSSCLSGVPTFFWLRGFQLARLLETSHCPKAICWSKLHPTSKNIFPSKSPLGGRSKRPPPVWVWRNPQKLSKPHSEATGQVSDANRSLAGTAAKAQPGSETPGGMCPKSGEEGAPSYWNWGNQEILMVFGRIEPRDEHHPLHFSALLGMQNASAASPFFRLSLDGDGGAERRVLGLASSKILKV